MKDPKYFLEKLMVLPHRGNGTPQLDQAAAIIFEEYKKMGLTPKFSEFKTGECMWIKESVALILVLLSLGLSFSGFNLFGLGFFVAGVSFLPETPWLWKKIVLRFFPIREKDVFAEVAPAENVQKTVVIFGHYDTPKECRGIKLLRFFVHTKLGNRMATDSKNMPPFFRSPLFLLNIALILAFPAVLLPGLSVFTLLAMAFSAPVLLVYLYFSMFTAIAPAVPGAFDNGTGTATVMALPKSRFRPPGSSF